MTAQPVPLTGGHLEYALQDGCSWVRIGAARAIASTPGKEAQTILAAQWRTVRSAVTEDSRSVAELISLAACLEWSRLDGGAQLVEALSPHLDELLPLLEGDWDPLVHHLNALALPRLPKVANRLFVELRNARGWRLYQEKNTSVVAEQPMTAHANAARTIEHDTWGVAPKGALEALFRPITLRLRSTVTAERLAGVEDLLRVALTQSHWYLRQLSHKALSYLGLEASLPLLSALQGKLRLELTGVDLERLSEDATYYQRFSTDKATPADAARTGRELQVFLAIEALQEFSDSATAAALARLVTSGGNDIIAARALRVLMKMNIEVCAPALFWECVNGALPGIRDAARDALARILDGVGRGEHQLRSVGLAAQLDPSTSLDWMLDLADRCRALPDWAADPQSAGSLSWSRHEQSCWSVLQNALWVVPQIEGESRIRISYSSLPAWDRFRSYLGEVVRQPVREPNSAQSAWRRPAIELAKRCLLGSPVNLTVQLKTVEAGSAAASTDFAVAFEAGQDHTDLLVVIKSMGFIATPGHATLRVPLIGNTGTLTFTLVATSAGMQTVELGFFRNTDRIGYCTVSTEVVEDNFINRTRTLVTPRASLPVKVWEAVSDQDLQRRGATRAVIFVDSAADGSLEFSLLDPAVAAEPCPIGRSPRLFSEAQINTWVTQQGVVVRDFLKEEYASDEDLMGAMMGLRALGHELYEQLVPGALTPKLDRFPRGVTLAIESNAHWVPWELLSPQAAGPALGERFQIVRIPRKPASSTDAAADPIPLESAVEPGLDIRQVLSVIGDDILSASNTAVTASTFVSCAPLVRDLIEGTLPALHSAVVDADILHFTCHGRSAPYHLSIGSGQGRRFFVKQVRTLDLKPGAVVFVNACSSAQSSALLSDMENFGFEFYARGARPFLGTLGPIPKNDAIRFAQLFYAAFIGLGMTAGDALAKAKREAAAELKRPSWLFYCLYGPASARRAAPSRGR